MKRSHHISGFQSTSKGMACLIFAVGTDRKVQKVGGLMLEAIQTLPDAVKARLEAKMAEMCAILDEGGDDGQAG